MPIPTQQLEEYTAETYVIIQAVSEYAGYLADDRTEEDNAVLLHLRAAVGALVAALDVAMRPPPPPLIMPIGATQPVHGPFAEFPHTVARPTTNGQPVAAPPPPPPQPPPRPAAPPRPQPRR
jgi:hypothetical protein